jgi:LmbE family N-acetylglucosaminyl deacetylase
MSWPLGGPKLVMGHKSEPKTVAVIVAHPDDETLWAGGTILSQPSWSWFIATLCRASDRDRAPRFFQALEAFGAGGRMSDMDDGPEQKPLTENEVQETILRLLPQKHFNLIISHNPAGEYTRHLRHEEIGKAVITLWHLGKISADELWMFAYEDGGKQYLPRPIKAAHIYHILPQKTWQKKYSLITSTYGLEKNGFEAKTTPRAEAFWQFTDSQHAQQWLDNEVFHHESSTII